MKSENPCPSVELYNADCMEVMKKYPDNYFDLAIVDPPYGIDINKSGRLGHYGGKGKKWDSSVPDRDYFYELDRISRNMIIWGGNYFPMPPTRCFLIWDKKQPEAVSFSSCEYAWTNFDSSAKTFYLRPQSADEQRIHPTQKPVALYEWLFKKYAKNGDKILDTHLGSGSIVIALDKMNKIEKMNLSLVGCELDEDYFKASVERIKEQTSQMTIFE